MTDAEKVSQALAELWDIVRCRCNEAYTGRGLHDPDCECDSAEAVKIVADRIKALTKERDEQIEWVKRLADDLIAAEAKLAKAVEALQLYADPCDAGSNGCPYDGNMCCMTARATIAEIKGGNDAKSDL